MYVKRTATRRDLERFNAYSSALLGLLNLMLAEIAKVQQTVKGLLRISLRGIRYFFSGCERDRKALKMIREAGGLMVLMSYWHLRDDKKANWLRYLRESGFLEDEKACVLLDSGAYGAYNAKEKGKEHRPLSVKEYAEFIEQHRPYLSAWLNLDVIGDDQATRDNFDYLARRGLRPVPVWPITGSLDDLDRVVQEDHAVIAIGGIALQMRSGQKRPVLQRLRQIIALFPEQNFHLLGCAHIPTLAEIAPFSADSAAPINVGGSGRLITKIGQRYAPAGMSAADIRYRNVREMAKLEWQYGFVKRASE